MTVKIRLMRIGKKKSPKYRVIVIHSQRKQTSRYLENIGVYDPMLEKNNLNIDLEKVKTWCNKGAVLSKGLAKLLPKTI